VKLGYAFWGFLSDYKIERGQEVSTPDGNAAYSWSILWEAQQRGWETHLLHKDRDAECYSKFACSSFGSFSQKMRDDAYRRALKGESLDELKDLDVVLLEWRWPIPGRNSDISITDPAYQPDLDRQREILKHCVENKIKLIIWDLDHKLTLEDVEMWKPDAVFETSVWPHCDAMKTIRVEPPIVINELYQFDTLPASESRKLVYIGSRYERDDVIEKWIKPVSDEYPFEVEFWGNWTREPNLSECREMWPNILYNRRITMKDFRGVYGTAAACPILGKSSYLNYGFITPRPWEALMFGTIPVGLSSHVGIYDYVMNTARNPDDLMEIVYNLSVMDCDSRDKLRRANIEKLRFMDVSNFVNKIVRVL